MLCVGAQARGGPVSSNDNRAAGMRDTASSSREELLRRTVDAVRRLHGLRIMRPDCSWTSEHVCCTECKSSITALSEPARALNRSR